MGTRAVAGEITQALAVDVNGLAALKRQAGAAPQAALNKAASQFEAMFLQMLLKSMRESLPKDGPFASEAANTYVGMFDQQIAQKLADKGIGLAKMIEKQLLPKVAAGADGGTPGAAKAGGTPAAAGAAGGTGGTNGAAAARGAAWSRGAAGKVAAASLDDSTRFTAGSGTRVSADRLSALLARSQAAAGVSGRAPATGVAPAPSAATVVAGTGAKGAPASVPDTVRDFVDKMRPYAEAASKAIGVPAQLLLAQAGLETGWGRHQPKAADGSSSHNLFGIKANPAWTGAAVAAATTEYVAGAAVRVAEKFRSYGSYTEAFQDFGRLIRDSGRYAAAYASVDNPAEYAKALQKGGYATDPQYADKLMRAFRMVATHVAASAAPAQVLAGTAVNENDPA